MGEAARSLAGFGGGFGTFSAEQIAPLLRLGPQTAAEQAKLLADLDFIERELAKMTAEWRDLFASAAHRVPVGQDAVLDGEIDRMLAYEHKAADQLAEIRRSWDAVKHMATPFALTAWARVEEAMIGRCEALRDARWDLMTLQSERRDRSTDRPFTSVSDLRRQVIAIR